MLMLWAHTKEYLIKYVSISFSAPSLNIYLQERLNSSHHSKKKTTPTNFCSRLNPLPLPVNLFYPHRIEIRCHSHIFTHPSLLSDGQMAGGSHLLQRPSDRIASVRWRWNFAHISPLTRTKRKRKRKLNLVATAAGLLLGPRFTPAATRAVRQFLGTLSYFQP